jgi:hypothetical protein
MYGKIFESIYDGTLVEDWRALITFQQFIVLCDADGILDMTPSAISRRTGIPIEHIKAGIDILENDDPYSRSPTENGRRIVRLDAHRNWGWVIVNHKQYRDLQDAEMVRKQTRERVKRFREKRKNGCNVTVTDGNASNAKKRYTDTDTDTNTKKKKNSRFAPPSIDEIKQYCIERNNGIDPESFYNFYESKGWMIGKNKMKSWKAAIHTWEKRNNKVQDEYRVDAI